MYKFLISIFFIFLIISNPSYANNNSFISISPTITEIIYSIDTQDQLKGVTTQCNFPEEAKQKPIIGDYYYINEQMLLDIKPNYILADDLSAFIAKKYKKYNIEPICLKFTNINSIYENILFLGKLTNKEENSINVVTDIKNKVKKAKSLNKHPNKKVLYIISTKPFRTIGKNSFITNIITESGNISITSELNTSYPIISLEYAINKNPDIIILDYHCNKNENISKLFPNSRIIKMTKQQSDIIDRPSPRFYKSIEFFAQLGEN